MPRVTSVVCHVSIKYCDTCQINVWISIWSSYCKIDLIWVPIFLKKFSISGTPNLDQILLLYNVMIIFIKIDIFIKYFININYI